MGQSFVERLLLLLLVVSSLMKVSDASYQRIYLQAESFIWDYAPSGGINNCTGDPFTGQQSIYTTNSDQTIGSIYKKARFQAYKSLSFTDPIPRPDSELHMGVLSSPIRAEVGDTLVVVVRNTLPFPINMVPGFGGAESPSSDPTPINPGDTTISRWVVPESAGPGVGDLSSNLYLYRSNIDRVKDMYTGLFGPMVIYRSGALIGGKPAGVDSEQFSFLWINDETQSHFIDDNVQTYLPAGFTYNSAFLSGNRKYCYNVCFP